VCSSQIDSNCSDDVHLVRRRRRTTRKEQGENKKSRKEEEENKRKKFCCSVLLSIVFLAVFVEDFSMLLECVAAADFLQAFSSIMMKGGFSFKLFFGGFKEFLSNLLCRCGCFEYVTE
jgi:hypothetical protein